MLETIILDYDTLIFKNRNIIKDIKKLIEAGTRDQKLFDMLDDCIKRIKDMEYNKELANNILVSQEKIKCL